MSAARLSAAELAHLARVAPRLARAGLTDWRLVEQLLAYNERLETILRRLAAHLPPELQPLVPLDVIALPPPEPLP